MFAMAGLNAGLFVRGDHELIWLQEPALPAAGVQIEDAASFDGKVRIAWKDPTAMVPGPNRIFMQPAPDRAIRNRRD